jgi:hypothetical protein
VGPRRCVTRPTGWDARRQRSGLPFECVRNFGKAAALALSLLAVAATMATCGSTPLKGVAVHLPKATTSTTIDSAGVPPPSRKTTLPTDTSTSIATATTATVPDCVASDLTMTARPQLSSYSWNETMNVIVEVLIQSGPSCRLLQGMFNLGDPSAGCYPDVFMHLYDAQLSPSNGRIQAVSATNSVNFSNGVM